MPRTKIRYNWRQNLSQPRVLQLPNIASQNAVNARLAQFPLEQQAREAQLSRAAAAEAQARYKLTKEIETDRQRTAFYNGLQELEQTLNSQGHTVGTKEHAEAFAAYAHEFPLARSSTDVAQMLKIHAHVNDDQAALTERMKQSIAAGKELGLQPAGASFIKGGNVDVRFKMPEEVEAPEPTATPESGVQAATDYGQQLGAPDVAETKQMLAPNAAPTATPAPSAVPSATPNHSAALDWANANPNDPRAAVIIDRAKAAVPSEEDEGQ